ncbi:MAG TPA: helical backbone metal receptor [Gemmatimonadaceae bacterium]|nr:helical backbone metal receptor [Gemmatimonadaceae bacterium]
MRSGGSFLSLGRSRGRAAVARRVASRVARRVARTVARTVAGLMACAALAACAGHDAPRAPQVSDDFGDSVAAGTTSRPNRIVSLSPATTELLFAIGAGPRVVGRTHWDVSPDSARLVPDLGAGLRPNVEAVLATHPDLVVLYASRDDRAAAAQLKAAGVPVLALRTDRIADFRRAAILLGRATGESARAQLCVDTVDQALARVRAATRSLPHPTVFWHIWDEPVITVGSGSFQSELLDIAGARNVYADDPRPSPQVSLEDIVRRNPDLVLAGSLGAARIRSSAKWQAVPAVRLGHIVVVDTALVGRPSVRLGEAAAELARLLHPGQVP